MTTRELVAELKKKGYSVKYRERTDGGVLITEINNMKFTGSKGNAEARHIVGVELSPARIEQTQHNAIKLIKGKKEKTLDKKMKDKLRKVQRTWKKNKTGGGKATITAKKVKHHIKTEGREATEEYLDRMTLYSEGYAYPENVEYLAQYIEDTAKGILTDDELQNEFYALADYIRSKKDTFREEWINKVYGCMYDCVEALSKGLNELARSYLIKVYQII